MPLPIAHGFLGASIIAAIHPQPSKRHFIPLFAGAFLANCADADFLLVWLSHAKSWHRAFTHSLAFALMLCLLPIIVFGLSRLRESLAYGTAFASHGVLDYVTTKVGGGVELLWPFTQGRAGLGLLGLSELPSRMTGVEIVKALVIELMIFGPMLALVLLIRYVVVRRQYSAHGAI
ncbi:MAG TPA: metal-dependent hydrolase [Blastocatellia bacterium]|nr:metal-dependent hydrolase [Blastocatellia bacterium]